MGIMRGGGEDVAEEDEMGGMRPTVCEGTLVYEEGGCKIPKLLSRSQA